MRPFRSVLYMPGSNPRALEKARSIAADALILDLEDAVAPSEKSAARALICEAVNKGYGQRTVLVRVNALDTEWGKEDVEAIAGCSPDAILLPKVGSARDIQELNGLMSGHANYEKTRIWAMMESPLGVLNALEIAQSSDRLEGFVLGTNDLVKDLSARNTGDRLAVQTSLATCLLAARAAGLVCVDGVFNDLNDAEGLEAECTQGRIMGFDGKSLIHPKQVDPANTVFAPSDADLAEARSFVTAFDAAIAEGNAVAVVNGRIVENLHVETAKQLLAQADAIAKMAGSGNGDAN